MNVLVIGGGIGGLWRAPCLTGYRDETIFLRG